ncbi:MAG: hypothetical protein AAF715_30685 [Myxococcota bacterium]
MTNLTALLVSELETNPARFKVRGGYERLLKALRDPTNSAESVCRALRVHTDYTGDILWTICELEHVEAFVRDASEHISDADPGTAAYAVEIVLRGAHDDNTLQKIVDCLISREDYAVVEHAVRTLSGEGLARIEQVFLATGWPWVSQTLEEIHHHPFELETIQALIEEDRADRRFLGVVLATLASEEDERGIELLENSTQQWIREHGEWAREVFGK